MSKVFLRVISLLLMLFMLQLPVLAAEVGDAVAVPNPSFEEADGEWAAEWSHMETEEAVFELDTSKANTGENSIYISAQKENKPWAATNIFGLEPGTFYELSVFINSNVTGTQGAGIKLEYYSADTVSSVTSVPASSIANTYPNDQFFYNTNNRFAEHKTIFQVPEGTHMTKLYLRVHGLGEAWFDDVSLKFSGGPEKYKFDTEKVFHYKEETGGDAFVKVDNFYAGQGVSEDTLVDFAVYDGETVCEQIENVPVADMEARYTYSTSYMEPYKKYTLKCKIKNRAGGILEEHEQNLYVVDRPSMMSEDGYLMVDGERFNPIIGYHVNIEDYPRAVEAGLNTVQISWGNSVITNEGRNTTLAALEESGLKGIFCLYVRNQNAGHPDVIENTKQIVEVMKDNPNIIAYALMDEPFLKGDDPDRRLWSEEAYLAIRQIDKTHPVYICDKRAEHISVKYCDILCLDSYSMGGDTRGVTRDSINTYAATKDKNKFWELAATYNNNGKFPTMNDARNSIYRAFEEGATGMGYFSFSDAGGADETKQQLYTWDLWEDFCTFNNVEAPILFDRFVNGNAVVFNEYDDGGEADSLKWFSWFIGEDMYLVAHNRSRGSQEVEIPLESKNGKVKINGFSAEPIGLTTQSAVTGSSSITLTLGSEEIALFKINPTAGVDLSRLAEARFDDLAEHEWAREAIEALDSRNIVNTVAEGKYGPGEAITRLDFVSFLVRALGLTAEGEAFPDCDAKEIKIARNAGIVMGDTDGNFRPLDTITRQDIMTTAARALKASATEEEIPAFSDWNLVSDYALDAVKCMVQAKVIVGNGDGTVNPQGLATRAEAAVMLHRILNTTFASAGVKPPAPGETREEITFTDPVDEKTLQKWSDATDLLKALGIGAPQAEKSVVKGEFEGYIANLLGTGYEAFSDDMKALTYAEAVEALVKLLGYEAQANAGGGFMAMAAQLDLTAGISAGEYIRGGELAVLLVNAFDIKMAERTAYGSDERYAESDDTLLSLYKNIYKYTGVVEGDYYSGAAVRKNQILIDGQIYNGGEGFLGQRVVVYAEHAEDEKNIKYIKAASSVKVVTLEAEDILVADTSVVRYEDENGKESTVSVNGAVLYHNGERKTAWTASDLMPAMGTVTLIENSGAGADFVLVEAYENRVVQSVYTEDNAVYFKNGPELILDKTDTAARYSMDFETADIKAWNILSVFLREDGTLYKVLRSEEKAQGLATEVSGDDVLIGESEYTVANNCLGSPVLGEEGVFYLDFAGKIAAVDDAAQTPEYGYFTAMAQDKGIDGGVSLRIFTKEGEMKIFKAADTVKINGRAVAAANLLTEPVLLEGTAAKGQLIVYTFAGEEVTEIETAQDAQGVTHQNVPDAFSMVLITAAGNASAHYAGYGQSTLGGAYRITDATLTFVVPEQYSEDARDYSVTKGKSPYTHAEYYYGSELYDWDEDFGVGAVVRKVSSALTDVDASGTVGVVLSVGDALDADGNIKKGIRVLVDGYERTIYAEEDFKIVLNETTLTDINGGETQVTETNGTKVLNPSMPATALNRGDVVLYELGGVNGDVLTGMRVLLRANSPRIGETGSKKFYQYSNYSDMTVAYGVVTETMEDGFAMFPGQYERLVLHYSNGSKIAPVIIYDRTSDTVKASSIEAIRVGDTVFSQRTNPYTKLIVVYR